MSPRPDLPGILVHAIHRLHRNAVQTKLSAMGLEGVGSPMILMLLKRRDALAAADAQMLAGFTAQERETLTALHLRMLDNLTPGDSPAGDPFERLGCNCSRP